MYFFSYRYLLVRQGSIHQLPILRGNIINNSPRRHNTRNKWVQRLRLKSLTRRNIANSARLQINVKLLTIFCAQSGLLTN